MYINVLAPIEGRKEPSMARKFGYINEAEENQLSFNPLDNTFTVLGEILNAYHESCIIGRYQLEVNIYPDGDVQMYAYRLCKWAHRPLKFYIRSYGNIETYIKIGKLDGEGANLLNRLMKAFNL